MKNADFAEATGYLRAVEKKILSGSNIDRLIDAPSVEEALEMLSQNSEYDFSTLERPEDYELVLKAELKRVYDMLYKLSPTPKLVEVLCTKYDYHNIKVAIKAYFLKKNHDNLFIIITETNVNKINETIVSKESKELKSHIVEAINAGVKAFESTKEPQYIDMVLDKLMFSHMLDICKEIEIEFVTKYVKTSIDFYNIKALLRIKNMQKGLKFLDDVLCYGGLTDKNIFLEHYDKAVESLGEAFYYKYFGDLVKLSLDDYEKTGNFSALEKIADNYLLNEIKMSKYVAYGPELLFAYGAAKENEIKQVRILITCKANNISNQVLQERLRDNYV